METKAQPKSLLSAIAKFQTLCPSIQKNKQGYGYKYAEFSHMVKVINPVMALCNISFLQPLTGSSLKTIIFHTETGEILESEFDLTPCFKSLEYYEKTNQKTGAISHVLKGFDGMNTVQAQSSVITYFKRVCLSTLLGITTEEDIDGSVASKNERAYIDTEIENAGNLQELESLFKSMTPANKGDKKIAEKFSAKKAELSPKTK